jgi:CRP-like cAMP-binding protein
MRHQFATIHELARITMLAGLPGDTLGKLAERMERRALAPGEVLQGGGDGEAGFTIVISGLLQTEGGQIVRPGETLGGLASTSAPVRAVVPSVVASCRRETFDELVRPALGAT